VSLLKGVGKPESLTPIQSILGAEVKCSIARPISACLNLTASSSFSAHLQDYLCGGNDEIQRIQKEAR
jgi:hypothetical protein